MSESTDERSAFEEEAQQRILDAKEHRQVSVDGGSLLRDAADRLRATFGADDARVREIAAVIL